MTSTFESMGDLATSVRSLQTRSIREWIIAFFWITSIYASSIGAITGAFFGQYVTGLASLFLVMAIVGALTFVIPGFCLLAILPFDSET